MSFGARNPNQFQGQAPAAYVAGVGRGASGFTTRSDIGPARSAPAPTADAQFGQAPAGYVAGRGRGMGVLAREQDELSARHVQEETDRADYSESNYDQFSGYGERLFTAGTPYEEDDAEADRIYDSVDEFMEGRRKRKREQQMLEEQRTKARSDRPKIADQFADLKRDLASVTAEQWDSIPDIGDHSLKLKQKSRKETYAPLPDYLISGGGGTNPLSQLAAASGGLDTPAGPAAAGGTQTVTGLAEARGTVLSLKLDKMSDSVSGQVRDSIPPM